MLPQFLHTVLVDLEKIPEYEQTPAEQKLLATLREINTPSCDLRLDNIYTGVADQSPTIGPGEIVWNVLPYSKIRELSLVPDWRPSKPPSFPPTPPPPRGAIPLAIIPLPSADSGMYRLIPYPSGKARCPHCGKEI